MSSNSAFKDSAFIVNANLVGIRKRVRKPGSRGNYALRNTWGCTDRLRGVMGKYFTQYNTSKGPNLASLASDKIGNGFNRKQVRNLPLRLTEIPSTNDGLGPLSGKLLIELNREGWNNLAYSKRTKHLLRREIEESGIDEGDPYWRYFLKTGFPENALGKFVSWGAHINPPATINTTETYLDYTTLYYTPSSNEGIRAKSGAVVRIEPVYNYYADTTPPYEQISQLASEPMLTNFYCLESEMRNTGSTLNSPDYFAQITLNETLQQINIDNDPEPDPWFQSVAGPEGSMTESKTVQLYTLYSKGLNQLNTTEGLGSLKDVFNTSYKNIVILNSDLMAMSDLITRDDDTSGLSNLPFYNKITIGYDREAVSDAGSISKLGGASWLRELKRDIDTSLGSKTGDQLIDIMQLYIIQNLEGFGDDPSDVPVKIRKVTKLSDTNPRDLQLDVTSETVEIVFDMDDFMDDITTRVFSSQKGFAPTRIEDIVERINTNQTTDDNFILIRNYNQNPVEVSSTPAREFLKLDLDDQITPYPVRNVEELILKNKFAPNETILYKIDKRLVKPNGETSAPVQTFYIGRFFDQVRDIHYVDSQVKYGVRYQYDISEIKIVFGNRYSYNDLKLFFGRGAAGYGRAVGNALGFYRPVQEDILMDDVIDQALKPYVPRDEEPPFSAVGIDTVGPSVQTGYYIYKPTNPEKIDARKFATLFYVGTDYVGRTSDRADYEALQRVKIQIREGFGFDGNLDGGAVGAAMDLPIVPTQVPAPQPKPPPKPKKPRKPRKKPVIVKKPGRKKPIKPRKGPKKEILKAKKQLGIKKKKISTKKKLNKKALKKKLSAPPPKKSSKKKALGSSSTKRRKKTTKKMSIKKKSRSKKSSSKKLLKKLFKRRR